MAAKTLKEAISNGIEKHNAHLPCNMLVLRMDIVNEIRDYMAHEFMKYSSQSANSQVNPDNAELVADTCLGLFDRLFAGIPAFTTEKDTNEYKKRN